MPGFNCLFVKDGIILVGGVEKVQAIRTYFDKEWGKWVAVVRSGQEYGGERGIGDTRKEAVRHLRDGLAVVEDYRKRDHDQAQKLREERTGKKKLKPAAVVALVAAVVGDFQINPEEL
jgi:hypothetical protein